MSASRAACALAAGALLSGSIGCGGADDHAVVVRVGGQAITKAIVDHWTSVIDRGAAFAGFRGKPPGSTPGQRALVFLISSSWLLGEAARQHLPISEEAVNAALAEREQGTASAEFRKSLHRTGETLGDVKTELRAELAIEAIRQELARRASEITQQEVVAYYRRNRRQLAVPAARAVDLIEQLPSPAAANALVKRIGTGRRFSEASGYHEVVSHTPGYMGTPEKARLVNAIFAARIGVASRPMKLFNVWAHSWVVFVVRKDIPARLQPLAKVRSEVVERLRTRRQRELATAFDREYRDRWPAATSCSSGNVVPGCKQSHIPTTPYQDPFATTEPTD
jgi:hypothetical protein